MKLFDFALAPNPKRVRVYLAEKRLDIPIEQVNIMGGKNRTPEFLGKEPDGRPARARARRRHASHRVARHHGIPRGPEPEPADARHDADRTCAGPGARAHRRAGRAPARRDVFQNTSPFFAGRVKQQPDAAQRARTARTRAPRSSTRRSARAFVAARSRRSPTARSFAAFEFAQFAGNVIDSGAAPT